MASRILLAPDKDSRAENQPTLRMRKDGPEVPVSGIPPHEPLEAAARAFQDFLQDQGESGPKVAEWQISFPGYREHAQLFHDLHRHNPLAADRLARAMTNMPAVGTEFLGFHLLAELGRGAFARVYLAEQADLAKRHVVLKLAADIWGEAQTLAQLHHPNIIPIYSVHHCEPFQAVCMPFQGSITLQDVLKEVQQRDALPTTGKYLIQAFQSAISSQHVAVDTEQAEVSDVRPPTSDAPPSTDSPAAAANGRLETLKRLSYVEAIVSLGTELADGLAHAHEHGIIHRDLKPANVLLTDQGQPMLLDFNVAEDTKLQAGATVAWVAGTLPYMAPEQLAAMQGRPAAIDARCDLYAFGIVMFELLTGRYPFAFRRPMTQIVMEQMVQERSGSPPRLRCWNPAVSPALEAIVRRCLEPDPARRYQTARHLQEDLDCQNTHRPLRHTAEPSFKERLGKWTRRHPRLWAMTWLAALAGILLLGLGTFLVAREEQLTKLQEQERERNRHERKQKTAQAGWQKFQEDLKTTRFLLYTRSLEPDQRNQGLSLGFRLLEDYRVLENPAWQQTDLVQGLSEVDQQRLGRDMAELLLLMARAMLWEPEGEQSQAVAEKALRLNERAAACNPLLAVSPALWQQRAELHTLLGQKEQARECRTKAGKLTVRSAQDHFLLASDHLGAGRLSEALPLLQKATWQDPQHFWAWFVLGNCHERLGRDARAEACYGACIALWPRFPWAHFNRGLAYHRQQEYLLARVDFDKVLELQPNLAEAYFSRALAHQALKQYAEAEEDLTQALQRGFTPTRLYFLRARIREKRGDMAGARQDYAEGMRQPPTDEKSLVSRGYANLNTNPQAALKDFEEALRLNPRSALALQNKAHVLAEKLGRTKEALEVLNKAVELYPESTQARGGRGVLLARLGQRDRAIQDAKDTLARDTTPLCLYQVACIYALNAPNHPEDRHQAYQLLSDALRKGFGFPLMETDPDLAPLRGQPEFRRLVEAARALQPSSPSPKKS